MLRCSEGVDRTEEEYAEAVRSVKSEEGKAPSTRAPAIRTRHTGEEGCGSANPFLDIMIEPLDHYKRVSEEETFFLSDEARAKTEEEDSFQNDEKAYVEE